MSLCARDAVTPRRLETDEVCTGRVDAEETERETDADVDADRTDCVVDGRICAICPMPRRDEVRAAWVEPEVLERVVFARFVRLLRCIA